MSKSPHILNSASNLLGFCLVVLTSIKIFGKAAETIIDEIDAVTTLLFVTSCVFSFLSIRQEDRKDGNGRRLEKIAEIIFLVGLGGLSLITVLFVIESFT